MQFEATNHKFSLSSTIFHDMEVHDALALSKASILLEAAVWRQLSLVCYMTYKAHLYSYIPH